MTAIPKCPTCGRRPSERTGVELREQFAQSGLPAFRGTIPVVSVCADPCHVMADLGPSAVQLLREYAEADDGHWFLLWHSRLIALLAAAPEVKP